MNLTYVFSHGDAVLIAVFLSLLAMSIITWLLILQGGWRLWRYRQASRALTQRFWSCQNWDEAEKLAQSAATPMAAIAMAGIISWRHYHRHPQMLLGRSCALDEFLVRSIRHALTQAGVRLESGLTVLASVGSTAPFIGLFGTVWGIYHALIGIANQGNANLETVAGPMGEALIATAAGLATALPAVLGYNALIRGNRLLRNDMDGFAHDLHAHLLSTPVEDVAQDAPVVQRQQLRSS